MMALDRLAGDEEQLFHRKIEFHLARKQFNGFATDNNNGFKLVTLNPKPVQDHNKPGSANKPNEVLEKRVVDPELSFTITYRRIGAGLRNLGNTCYLNSVLQCLTYTEPLAAYLQSGKHQSSCRTAGFCALCAIQKHVGRALQSTGRILEPKDLVSNLRCISRNFRNSRQEDAHEYMMNLLESMHKCCLPSGVSSESPSAYEKSLVHKIFGGRLRSQVKCTQCSYCSNKFDPFLDLSLEINKADSLHKALAHFTAKEHLDGGAKQYNCQQCKQKVKALKQLTVYKAPNVLAIHLKRFGSHSPGQKIVKDVSFVPNLDMKPFVSGPYDGDLKYTLYGVLVHAGWSTRSGHYYCFVRTSSGMWYTLDDNHVYQVSEKKVLAQKAYMLFYVRDRGSVVAKKSIDINHKESMAANSTVPTKLNAELRPNTENGTVERKIEASSTALPEIAVLPITNASKETPSEKKPLENGQGSVLADSSTIKLESQSESSLVVPPENDSEKSSFVTINSVCKPESSVTTEASVKALTSGPDAKIVDCINRVGQAQDMDTDKPNMDEDKSADNAPPSSDLSTTSKELGRIRGSSTVLANEKAVPEGVIEEMSITVGSSKSLKKRSIDDLSSGNPATTEQLSAKNKRPKLKMKRKLFMYQVSGMPLSSSIIFGTALGMKKKQKKRKSRSLRNTSNILSLKPETEDLTAVNSYTQSESVKENCIPNPMDGDKSERNAGGNGVISGALVSNELKQRLKMDSAQDTRGAVTQGPNSSQNLLRESKQRNITSLLMRGLEEKTVERWDGISVSLSEKEHEESELIIGHVGDEWDEEYDRGKRKKIRSAHISFEGPNLFQAIASRNNNTQRKRPKLH